MVYGKTDCHFFAYITQAVWSIKTKALAMLNYVDETEMEEQGVGDLLLDENTMAAAPR